MSKYSISSRMTKKLPDDIEPQGEITVKELRLSHKKRIRKILKEDNPITCRILRDEYRYSTELTDKKQKCFILTDDGVYLKVMPSALYCLLPLPFILFILNNIYLMSVVAVGVKFSVILGIAVALSPHIPLGDGEAPSVEQTTKPNTGVGDYSGDELDDILTPETPDDEERYTIIDGIIYHGDYLTIGKGKAIPLGNNPENVKTGVLLEFIVLEGDKEVFRSPKLEPGTGVNFVPSDYLTSGIHELNIVVDVWHRDGQKDIGGNQVVSINIVD